MPAPHVLFPQIEGIIGSVAGGNQGVALWIQNLKRVMLNAANKDATNYEFVALTDIDEDGSAETNAAPLTTCTHVFGILLGTVSTDAERDWVTLVDADTNTFDGTAALANSVEAAIQLPAATAAITEPFVGTTWETPLTFGTGLTIAADGRDGTNPALNDIRGWVLIRAT